MQAHASNCLSLAQCWLLGRPFLPLPIHSAIMGLLRIDCLCVRVWLSQVASRILLLDAMRACGPIQSCLLALLVVVTTLHMRSAVGKPCCGPLS